MTITEDMTAKYVKSKFTIAERANVSKTAKKRDRSSKNTTKTKNIRLIFLFCTDLSLPECCTRFQAIAMNLVQ